MLLFYSYFLEVSPLKYDDFRGLGKKDFYYEQGLKWKELSIALNLLPSNQFVLNNGKIGLPVVPGSCKESFSALTVQRIYLLLENVQVWGTSLGCLCL